MQSSQQLRSTSGCSCSTSSRCSTAAPRIAYFIVRADSEPRPTKSGIADGWLGSSCFLQRRPSYPKTALTAREVASLDTPVTSVQNGKPFRIYETTEFVAETLLPTIQGNFRVRAYRHTVSAAMHTAVIYTKECQADTYTTLQVDGGRTYTEPCCIMTGQPEGCENVSLLCFCPELPGSFAAGSASLQACSVFELFCSVSNEPAQQALDHAGTIESARCLLHLWSAPPCRGPLLGLHVHEGKSDTSAWPGQVTAYCPRRGIGLAEVRLCGPAATCTGIHARACPWNDHLPSTGRSGDWSCQQDCGICVAGESKCFCISRAAPVLHFRSAYASDL